MSHFSMAASAIVLAGLTCGEPALAANEEASDSSARIDFSPTTATEARHVLDNAASVMERMTSDDRLVDLLEQSKGAFIVPNLFKGGMVVGGRGGEGVLVIHEDGAWSNPAFFDLGAFTLGAQAGIAAGPLVMLLMSDEAVRSFRQDDGFAIDASAGLSIFGYGAVARTGTDKGDVIVWAGPKGAFAGASFGASDISIDEDKNHAFYRKPVDVEAILEGKVQNPHTKRLQEKLPGGA